MTLSRNQCDCDKLLFPIQIGYWESFDGTQIRELDGTKSGAINGLDVSPDRIYFVTGGEDRLLKVRCYSDIPT